MTTITLRAPCTLTVERYPTSFRDVFTDGLIPLEMMGWDAFREHELTVDNRGAVIPLRPNHRLVDGDVVLAYGEDVRQVELRVWHDGSITIENEHRGER